MSDDDATTDQMKLTAEPVRVGSNIEREQLMMRLVGAECELRRAVVPDTLEGMLAQVIADRAGLGRERDQLRDEVLALEAERDRLLVDWREQDTALQRIDEATGIDGPVSCGADVARHVEQALQTSLSRYIDCLKLRQLFTEMNNYAEHETLYRSMSVGRTISGWADQLRQILSTDADSQDDHRNAAEAALAALRAQVKAKVNLFAVYRDAPMKGGDQREVRTIRRAMNVAVEELRQLLPPTDADK